MTSLIDDYFRTLISIVTNEEKNYPPVNIYTDDDENLYFEVAVTGWDSKDLEAYNEDNVLVIRGKKSSENDENKKYFIRKIAKRNFELKYMISEKYDLENPLFIELDKGVLKIGFKLKDNANKRIKYL